MTKESTRRGFVSWLNGVKRESDLRGAVFFGYNIGQNQGLGFSLDDGFEGVGGAGRRAKSITVVLRKQMGGMKKIKTFTYGKDGKVEYSTFEKALDAAKRFATTYLTTIL